MKVLLSLRYSDLRETAVGLGSILKTLGWIEGGKAVAFGTRRHLAAVWRGEGLYPEPGKRRVWLKLHYLKMVYEYLRLSDETTASERFESIARGPTLRFICNLIPPSRRLTRDYMLHHLWREMIEKDSNIVSEACPPEGNSASMRVTRCFINEVSRDIGLLPLADRLCHGDFLFWESYHPNITFSRTRTLVDGDPICDHTVTWTEGDKTL